MADESDGAHVDHRVVITLGPMLGPVVVGFVVSLVGLRPITIHNWLRIKHITKTRVRVAAAKLALNTQLHQKVHSRKPCRLCTILL